MSIVRALDVLEHLVLNVVDVKGHLIQKLFGRGTHVPDELAVLRHAARRQRVASNRAAVCDACPRAEPVSDDDIAA